MCNHRDKKDEEMSNVGRLNLSESDVKGTGGWKEVSSLNDVFFSLQCCCSFINIKWLCVGLAHLLTHCTRFVS